MLQLLPQLLLLVLLQLPMLQLKASALWHRHTCDTQILDWGLPQCWTPTQLLLLTPISVVEVFCAPASSCMTERLLVPACSSLQSLADVCAELDDVEPCMSRDHQPTLQLGHALLPYCWTQKSLLYWPQIRAPDTIDMMSHPRKPCCTCNCCLDLECRCLESNELPQLCNLLSL